MLSLLKSLKLTPAIFLALLVFPVTEISLGMSAAIAGSVEVINNKEPSPSELRAKIEQLQQALADYRKTGDRAGEADTLNQMGIIYVQLKEYTQAIDSHQQALAIYQKLNNKEQVAESLGYNGQAYFKAGQYQKIEDLFRQNLQSARNLKDREQEQLILELLKKYVEVKDIFARNTGEWFIDPAMTTPPHVSWKQILEITNLNLFINQEIGDLKSQGHNLHSLCWIYRNLGQYRQTISFCQKALQIAQDSKDYFREAFIRLDIALVYLDLGQYDLALEKLHEALKFSQKYREKIGTLTPEIDILSKLGLVYRINKRYESAIDYLQQALEKQELVVLFGLPAKLRPDILNNLGLVYFQVGEYSKALAVYNQALEHDSWTPNTKIYTLNYIGLVYAETGEYSKALDNYQQALNRFRELKDILGESETLKNIGKLLEKQNQPELAIVFHKESVNLTEEIRQGLRELSLEEQKTYTETVAETYRRLADLLLSQGRILEAQQVLELLKVQELRDYTKNRSAGGQPSGIATTPSETKVIDTHDTLIALGRQIEDCQTSQCKQLSQLLDRRETATQEFNQTVRNLEQEIRKHRANDEAFLDPTKLTRTADNLLSEYPHTVLIYPLVLEDKIWILWASSGGITKSLEVPKVGQKQLGETVLKFRQLLQNPASDVNEVKRVGKQLHDWLIPPSLQQELKANQIQNLIFSLDRVTRYIPMSALFDGEKYLLETYTISNIISADLTDTSDRLPVGTDNTQS
jgi:tetratricopeptide (TPR) repeat protein